MPMEQTYFPNVLLYDFAYLTHSEAHLLQIQS